MVDPIVTPPHPPVSTPQALSPTVALNPPMVGVASPFHHVDGQNRDLILEAIRAWARGPLFDWADGWQRDMIKWLDDTNNWLDTWNDEVVRYVQDVLNAVINNSIELQDPVLADILNNPNSQTRILTDTLYGDTAISNYIEDSESDISKALYQKYGAFSLEDAHAAYGTRYLYTHGNFPVGPSVTQGVHISQGLGGEIWSTRYVTGDADGIDNTEVFRCAPNGDLIESLLIIDGGHGNGVFPEVDSNGQIWLWCHIYDTRAPSGTSRYNFVRFPWRTGTVTYPEIENYRLNAISGAYGTMHFDEGPDLIGLRINSGEVGANFTIHSRANILSGVNAPIHSMHFDWRPEMVVRQDFTFIDDTWFMLKGAGTGTLPYDTATIYAVDADTGAVKYIRQIENLRKVLSGYAQGAYTEPEGLCVTRTSRGAPALHVTIDTGPASLRVHHIVTLHMGEASYPSAVADPAYGFSPFRDTRFSYAAGTTASTAEPISIKREGDTVTIRGRIDVTGGIPLNASTKLGTVILGCRPSITKYLPVALGSSFPDAGVGEVNGIVVGRLRVTPGGNCYIELPKFDPANPPTSTPSTVHLHASWYIGDNDGMGALV